MLAKKENRFIYLLMLCTFAILFLGGPICQGAEQTEVTFLLHKKVVKNTKGEIVSTKATSFSVYNATEFVEEKLKNEEMTIEKLKQEVLNTETSQLRKILTSQKKLATIATSAFGQEEVAQYNYKDPDYAVLEDGNHSNPTNPAVLFLEDESNLSSTKERAVPILIVLPVEDPQHSGEYLDKIDIYPKIYSYQDIPSVPDLPKKVPNKPFLPQTGEAKTMVALIGLILVGVISFIWKKREKIWRMSHEKNV